MSKHLPRQLSLGLANGFAVVAACLGLNALIKSNKDKARLKALAPSPTRVEIDTNDIFVAGLVATIAATLIGVLTFLFITAAILPATRPLANRTVRLQAVTLLLSALFLFGAMIPYMVFFVNRSAGVKAFIGNNQLPDSIVKQVAAQAGQDGLYKHFHYLKLFAILPWFAILFTLIAAGVLFVTPATTTSPSSHGSASPVMQEKEDAHPERA
jgi:hypothetical protein